MKFRVGKICADSTRIQFQTAQGCELDVPVELMAISMHPGSTGFNLQVSEVRYEFTFADPKDGGPFFLRVLGLGRALRAFQAGKLGQGFERSVGLRL